MRKIIILLSIAISGCEGTQQLTQSQIDATRNSNNERIEEARKNIAACGEKNYYDCLIPSAMSLISASKDAASLEIEARKTAWGRP